MPKFIATHGVTLGNPGDEWAKFARDESLDTPEGELRFSLDTDDAAVAARLRKLKDYGIAEVK